MEGEQCCKLFDPAPWDGKFWTWDEKRFIKDRVRTFLYMPLNFGKVMRNLDAVMTKAEASSPEGMSLSDSVSKWRTDLMVSVNKEVPGAENLTLSGIFFSKVYEGPFKDAGKWMNDFSAFVQAEGMVPEKFYSWYTTCPNCAKEHGSNHVVLFAKIG